MAARQIAAGQIVRLSDLYPAALQAIVSQGERADGTLTAHGGVAYVRDAYRRANVPFIE